MTSLSRQRSEVWEVSERSQKTGSERTVSLIASEVLIFAVNWLSAMAPNTIQLEMMVFSKKCFFGVLPKSLLHLSQGRHTRICTQVEGESKGVPKKFHIEHTLDPG